MNLKRTSKSTSLRDLVNWRGEEGKLSSLILSAPEMDSELDMEESESDEVKDMLPLWRRFLCRRSLVSS